MRLRNIPGADEIVSGSAFCIQEPEKWKGRWRELFHNEKPLHLEIGMGKGRFIMDLAKANPDINYIGVERYTSVLLRAVQKMELEPLPNIFFLCIDAANITEYFEEEEVDRIYLNFSDPWPKDRHAKRRLTSQEFLNRYEQILTRSGRIEFKTDNQELFQFSVDTAEAAERWQLDAKTFDLHHDDKMVQGNIMTEYEEKFSSKGNPICKMILSRILALMLVFLSAAAVIPPVSVKAEGEDFWPADIDVTAPSAVVMEVNTGTVLYEKNMDEVNYPASITKILTTLLAIENCDMDEIVTFSETAVFENEGETSNIARELGEQMRVEDVLYGIMLESANECAYAVAEHVGKKLGGDYRTFIDLMNDKAKELGCTNTHFNNANGLPDDQHWTSAHDMALIAGAAYQNEIFRVITGTGTYTIPADNKKPEYYCRNHHNMLYANNTAKYLYKYCTGGKTGYTDMAQSTLVTYAEKDGITLVCVVMREQAPNHWTDTAGLFDYCFQNFQSHNIPENEKRGSGDNVNYGLLNTAESFVRFDSESYVILPKGVPFESASFQVDFSDDGEDASAAVVYQYAGRTVGRVKLSESGARIEKMPLSETAQNKDSDVRIVQVNPWYIALVFAGCILLAVVIILAVRLAKNFYVIRHRIDERRRKRERFKEVKRSTRRRRRKKDVFRFDKRM